MPLSSDPYGARIRQLPRRHVRSVRVRQYLYWRGFGREEANLDRDEFNAVFVDHYVRVLRYVQRRVDDEEISQEITAETFTVAWRKRAQSEISLPWLYRTAHNKIGDHYKRSQRRKAAEAALMRRAEEAPVGVTDLDRLALAAALSTLTPREREVVMLTYWEGLSAREVARAVGGRESAIWVTLTRARAKMRSQLEDTPNPVTGGDHAHR